MRPMYPKIKRAQSPKMLPMPTNIQFFMFPGIIGD